MARTMNGQYRTGRMGGAIQPRITDPHHEREKISEQPERMGIKALKRRICGDGSICRKCECIDKCRYGQEYVKRGL